MQRVQRGYSIPDLELRESIKRDNKEQILPKYQAFYDRWGTNFICSVEVKVFNIIIVLYSYFGARDLPRELNSVR